MVIRWGNSRGDKSDGYHLGREEGKPITPGIPASEITAGSHRVNSWHYQWTLSGNMITHPFAEIKTNLLCPEDNYNALPTLFSLNCIFYNTLFVVVIRKELFITKTDIQTFFFLPKKECFRKWQLQIFITEKPRYSRLLSHILIHPNICTNIGLHILHCWIYYIY